MMGPQLAVAAAAVVADLVNAGISATAESATVRLPGVWVGATAATRANLAGQWEYQVDLYLVDQSVGDMRSYVALDELAGQVAQLWPLRDDARLEATTVSLPGAPSVPAYLYPITVTL